MSEGIAINETTGLCKYNICHYWYSPKTNFRFQPRVYSVRHDLTQKATSPDDVTINSVIGNH